MQHCYRVDLGMSRKLLHAPLWITFRLRMQASYPAWALRQLGNHVCVISGVETKFIVASTTARFVRLGSGRVPLACLIQRDGTESFPPVLESTAFPKTRTARASYGR